MPGLVGTSFLFVYAVFFLSHGGYFQPPRVFAVSVMLFLVLRLIMASFLVFVVSDVSVILFFFFAAVTYFHL